MKAPNATEAVLLLALARLLEGGTAVAAGVPVIIEQATNAPNQIRLLWPVEADRQYDVLTRTNLALDGWWMAAPGPIVPSNLIGKFQAAGTNHAQFFQVAARDTQPPRIVRLYPASNAVGVGRFARLSLAFADESGCDTNRFALTCNNVTLTNGSPGVSVSSNAFQFVPGSVAWGGYGGASMVSLVYADVRGNAATSTWTFTLEVEPVLAETLLHLAPPAKRAIPALAKAAKDRGVSFAEGLELVTIETNLLVFSYRGDSHPLYTNAILVSHDPAGFFYRRITSLADDTNSHSVTAHTTDVPLTALVQAGSFSPEALVTGGRQAAKMSAAERYGLSFSHSSEFTALPLEFDVDDDGEDELRLTPAILTLDLQGAVEVAFVISDWEVVALDAAIDASLEAELRSRLEYFAELAKYSYTKNLQKIPLGAVVGMIGVVPVWVELQLGVDLGFEAGAEAAVGVETGLDAKANCAFRLAWRAGEGLTYSGERELQIEQVPLEPRFEVSAEAFLYLQARLSALVYSLAGVSADYRRGPALEASYEAGDLQCEISLSDCWSVNVGMTIVGVEDDDLPNQTLFEEERNIHTWYWPEIPDRAPVFTRHPKDVVASKGALVTLEASATSDPAPAYQWHQDDQAIPLQTQPTLTFTMGYGAVGNYRVTAKNRFGEVSSTNATVELFVPPLAEWC